MFESLSPLFIDLPQGGNVDLLRLHNRPHDALRFRGVLIAQHLAKDRRRDLPRQPVIVFQPAALLRLLVADYRESVPVIVDLLLRLAMHLERDGLVELEYRTAVQRDELLSFQLEFGGHDLACRLCMDLEPFGSIAGDVSQSRMLEDGDIN